MKIICERELFSESISVVQRAVAVKSTIPHLEGILINTKENSIKLTGNNLEIAIECEIPARILEHGSVVLNSRMFGEIIRKMDGEDVTLEVSDDLVIKIYSGDIFFEITGMFPDEYPEVPNNASDMTFTIPEKVLRSMIKQTIYAVGTNANKIVLTGSLFDIKGDELTIVSLDGYRLALRKEKMNEALEDTKFIVPAKALNELLKVLKEDDKNVTIGINDKYAVFEIDAYRFNTRLIEGEFLNYNQIIPADSKTTVTADVKRLCDGIDRAALVIDGDISKYPIKIEISENMMDISCISKVGRMEEKVAVSTEGEGLTIGFNYRYLLDALKNCEEEKVHLFLNSPLSPCVIRGDEDNYTYLVLPVRMKNE